MPAAGRFSLDVAFTLKPTGCRLPEASANGVGGTGIPNLSLSCAICAATEADIPRSSGLLPGTALPDAASSDRPTHVDASVTSSPCSGALVLVLVLVLPLVLPLVPPQDVRTGVEPCALRAAGGGCGLGGAPSFSPRSRRSLAERRASCSRLER